MSALTTRISDLATRIATEIKTVKTQYSGNNQGSLTSLLTSEKSSLVAAINELVGSLGSLGYGDLLSSNNLSDVANAATALSNLGGLTQSEVDARVQLVVDTAPAALDTLNELAAALGDDANFAGTMTSALAGKSSTSHTHTGVYEPVFSKNNGFNNSYGTTGGTVCQGNDARLSDARVASDVSAWAKAASKPSYTYSEVGAAAEAHVHTGVYEPANANIQSHIVLTNEHINWKATSENFKTSGSVTIEKAGSATFYLTGNPTGTKSISFGEGSPGDCGAIGFGNTSSTKDFFINAGAVGSFRFKDTGTVSFLQYGVGNKTATPAYISGWDASGNMVECSSLPWGLLSGKPTSLSGYGITDAYTKTEVGAPDTNFVTVFEAGLV